MITGDGTVGTDGTGSVTSIPGLIATIHLAMPDLDSIIGHLIPGVLPVGTATDITTIPITGAIAIIMYTSQDIIPIIMFILVLVPMVLLPPAIGVLPGLPVEYSPIPVQQDITPMQIPAESEELLLVRLR